MNMIGSCLRMGLGLATGANPLAVVAGGFLNTVTSTFANATINAAIKAATNTTTNTAISTDALAADGVAVVANYGL